MSLGQISHIVGKVGIRQVRAYSATGQTGSSITFTATVSGGVPPYSYAWTFGDGTTAITNPASHTYVSAGTFAIAVVVTDSLGNTASGADTATVTTAVLPPPGLTSVLPSSGTSTTSFMVEISGASPNTNYSFLVVDPNLNEVASPVSVRTNDLGTVSAPIVFNNLFTGAGGTYTVEFGGGTPGAANLSNATFLLTSIVVTPSLQFSSPPLFETSPYDSISTPITNTTTAAFSGQVVGVITLGNGSAEPIGSGVYSFPPGETSWFAVDLAGYTGTGAFTATLQIEDQNDNIIGSPVTVTGTL